MCILEGYFSLLAEFSLSNNVLQYNVVLRDPVSLAVLVASDYKGLLKRIIMWMQKLTSNTLLPLCLDSDNFFKRSF